MKLNIPSFIIGILTIMSLYCLLFIVFYEKQQKVDLPEEYQLITKQDTLQGYYSNDTLVIRFNNKRNQITQTHICSDTTHKTCDGSCECDGFECN